MANHFEAELVIPSPGDVLQIIEALAAVGCKFEIDHDAVDPDGPTVFGWATGTTELSEDKLGDWLDTIVEPLGGAIEEWGFGRHPRRPAA